MPMGRTEMGPPVACRDGFARREESGARKACVEVMRKEGSKSLMITDIIYWWDSSMVGCASCNNLLLLSSYQSYVVDWVRVVNRIQLTQEELLNDKI